MTHKKVLIVGGSSGIGFAVAKRAHQLSAHVIITSRNATKRKAVFSELSEGSVKTYDMDITSSENYDQLFEETGMIDHLVITVKPEISSVSFPSTDVEEAKKAFDTKLWGSYRFIQAARSYIRKTGSITLTSGIAGEKIYEGASAMAIINSATETLCRVLAVELAPVRVNVVSPGFVEPKPEAIKKLASRFPAKRLASPDEIASAYLHLMKNHYITGTKTVVDGGARLV